MSALGNLVSNAVRYTPADGRITIRLGWDDGHAVFSVTDTGLGIAPEHIPRLTERFYRVDRSRSRDTGGTGLGLAIVKHVVSRHHAELRVSSEVGRGSVFRVIFPPERSVREAPGARILRAALPDCARRALGVGAGGDILATFKSDLKQSGPQKRAAFCLASYYALLNRVSKSCWLVYGCLERVCLRT